MGETQGIRGEQISSQNIRRAMPPTWQLEYPNADSGLSSFIAAKLEGPEKAFYTARVARGHFQTLFHGKEIKRQQQETQAEQDKLITALSRVMTIHDAIVNGLHAGSLSAYNFGNAIKTEVAFSIFPQKEVSLPLLQAFAYDRITSNGISDEFDSIRSYASHEFGEYFPLDTFRMRVDELVQENVRIGDYHNASRLILRAIKLRIIPKDEYATYADIFEKWKEGYKDTKTSDIFEELVAQRLVSKEFVMHCLAISKQISQERGNLFSYYRSFEKALTENYISGEEFLQEFKDADLNKSGVKDVYSWAMVKNFSIPQDKLRQLLEDEVKSDRHYYEFEFLMDYVRKNREKMDTSVVPDNLISEAEKVFEAYKKGIPVKPEEESETHKFIREVRQGIHVDAESVATKLHELVEGFYDYENATDISNLLSAASSSHIPLDGEKVKSEVSMALNRMLEHYYVDYLADRYVHLLQICVQNGLITDQNFILDAAEKFREKVMRRTDNDYERELVRTIEIVLSQGDNPEFFAEFIGKVIPKKFGEDENVTLHNLRLFELGAKAKVDLQIQHPEFATIQRLLLEQYKVDVVDLPLFYGLITDALKEGKDLGIIAEYIPQYVSYKQACKTAYDSLDVNKQTLPFSVQWLHAQKKLREVLSQEPTLMPFLTQLAEVNVHFSIENLSLEFIKKMATQENLPQIIETIKTIFPDYVYIPKENVKEKLEYDPIKLLQEQIPNKEILTLLQNNMENSEIYNPLVYAVVLRYSSESTMSNLTPQKLADFSQTLKKYLEKFQQLSADQQHTYANDFMLLFLVKHQNQLEEILEFAEKTPGFFELFEVGGKLFSNKDIVLNNLIHSEDPLAEAKKKYRIFTENVPYWESLLFFTRERLAKELENADSEYPISLEYLRSLTGEQNISNLIQGRKLDHGIKTIPFANLLPIYKKQVLEDYVKRTIQDSQSVQKKQKADKRNRERVMNSKNLIITVSTRIHGSNALYLPATLQFGNLAGEVALQENAVTDSFPFHVDLSIPDTSYSNVKEILQNSISFSFIGKNGKNDSQIFYLYEREGSEWDPGLSLDLEARHGLSLGGIPATETSGIILKNPSVSMEDVVQEVVRNGFYIPVYDLEGNLLFTPQAYDTLRKPYKEVMDSLHSDNFVPKHFVMLLKSQSEELRQLYEGINLPEAVEEHTIDVMNRFEEFAPTWNESYLLDTSGMRLLFSLHDIGKPLGHIEQHERTRLVANEVVHRYNIDQNTRALILEIATQDYLGDLMKIPANTPSSQLTVKFTTIAEEIHAMAKKLRVDSLQLADLLRVYYLCDAGAYPELGHIFTKEHGIPALSKEYEDRFLEVKKLLFQDNHE